MNPSLDYNAATCRYAAGSREHGRLLVVDRLVVDVLDSLDDGNRVVLANRAMRLGMVCGSIKMWPSVNYGTGSLDIERDGEVVCRMAVHR